MNLTIHIHIVLRFVMCFFLFISFFVECWKYSNVNKQVFFNCGSLFAAAIGGGLLLGKYAGGTHNIASNDISKLP